MHLGEYQGKASLTINQNLSNSELVEGATMGLATEVGKLASLVNTERFKDFDIIAESADQIVDIAGDVLWYIAEALTAVDRSLDEAAQINLAKIAKLYPKGR